MLAGAWRFGPPALWGLLAYALLALRIAWRQRARGRDAGSAALYALACVEGKFAECVGVLRYLAGRVAGRSRGRLIEYK